MFIGSLAERAGTGGGDALVAIDGLRASADGVATCPSVVSPAYLLCTPVATR
jgi:hypothetical protein